MSGARTTPTAQHGQFIVAERLARARELGAALAELIDDPDGFVAAARDGLTELADDAYRAELARVAPGAAHGFGVRSPLFAALSRQLRVALAESSPASALWLAQRLAEEDEREFAFIAQQALRRALPDDPERAWQLIRPMAHAARDWIAVDSLASLTAYGILLENFRWAEVEQLIYSSVTWERRLVASTIATLPYELPRNERGRLGRDGNPALTLIKSLLGDDQPEVQKALSWALRSWYQIQPAAVEELVRVEAAHAQAAGDGHRAWVLRDALSAPSMPVPFTVQVRGQLAGIRRRPDQTSTSRAHQVAREFAGVGRLADQAVAQQGQRQRAGAAR